ncbi:murein L,D-transpeptidase family protein [Rhizobium sp. PL01]|uniref:L,D-transpeptidase family protein n=1 Tax=Rhizobium sp. PL01 TaxID=3085631 RepID=UPI002980C449|nr:murein L,D-transpeptidase family protein [Rhizobium sp. PL01]MDW5317653.1 murein L,D-transpeptidase family protein [Rhizobium sp. PL01]
MMISASLSGCVQMSLDDLGQPSQEIPANLLADMRKKGMQPDSPVLIRIFKMESELEVWKIDGSGKYALLKIFPICRWSGKLGPKTKTGDRQAPEGFYRVTQGSLNPKSQFYLSFNLGYPNRLEAALGHTGEALMVHGACSSSGCFALTDQGVGEIYAVMDRALKGGQKAVQVQAFPFHMTPRNLAAHRDDENLAFWKNLKEGSDIFDVTRREPEAAVCEKRYVFNADFGGQQPANPLATCPVRIDAPDLLVAAKSQKEEDAFNSLSNKSLEPLAYQDGGMHPSFRTLLKQNGDIKLAQRVSDISYPISRPAAALADPFSAR